MRSVLALLLLIAVAFGAASAVHSEATMDVENVIDEDAAEDFAVAEETAEEESEDEATEEADEEEEEAAEEMSFAEVDAEVDADVEVDAEDAIDAELVDSLDEVADDTEEDVAEEDSENESESFAARGVGASCQSNTGTCIDTLKTKCGGSLIRGQCSGAASVVCCVPPARPAAAAPSTPASNAFPAGYDHSVGLRAELTPAGVKNLANLITVVVNTVFSKPFPLANVDLNQDGLAFTATGMNVQSMKIGAVALNVVAPSDLTGSLSNANAVVVVPSFVASKTSGFPKLTAKGALTITASNIGLKFNIRVGANTKGDSRLSATVTSLEMTADGLSFKFSQSWDSFILNGVQNLFKKVIMNTITKAVSTTGVDVINAQLAQVLNAVPLSIPFTAGPLSCTVHYGFEQVGLDTDGSLQLGQSFGVQCK